MDQVQRELDRILASTHFSKAGRQSRFLRHVVEKHLAGDAAALREIAIAWDVYERPPAYDPKDDPIVRVEASRLRGRLNKYYESEGASDSIRIDLPRGGYVPSIEMRAVPVSESTPVVNTSPVSTWMIGASLIVAIAILAGFWVRTRRTGPMESIVVLPFADLSEKKDLAYIAQGLTEQIQEELARVRELRVVGSVTAERASSNPDIRATASQLGVDGLLQGSVRAEGRKVRVSVRLYEGSSGSTIWSESFDGAREGLFELEEKIARSLTQKMEIQLAMRREGLDTRTAPQRARAYEFFTLARAASLKDSPAALDESVEFYQMAVTTDPSFAPAHAGLAGALIQSSQGTGDIERSAKARAEAQKALELDPNLPRAWTGLILYYRDIDLNARKARTVCADSLAKLPNASPILTVCGSIESSFGQQAKALDYTRRAVGLDPLSPVTHGALMVALYRSGKFDEAFAESETAIRLGSTSNAVYRHRALILAAKGDFAGGLKTIEDAKATRPGALEDWEMVRGYILGRMGRRTEAEQLIREFIASKQALPLHIGVIRLGMGDRSQALDLFEHALLTDRASVAHMIPQYYARQLDGDPRFEAIKKSLGLAGQ